MADAATDMNKGRVIYEDEAERHFRLAYPGPILAPFVEYYFEINQPATLAKPLYLNGLPNLSNLLCISLQEKSWLSINQKNGAVQTVKGSRFLGNLTNLHTTIYPGGVHEFYVKFKPGVLGHLLRISHHDVENANVDLSCLIRLNEWQEPLQIAHSFRERVGRMEAILQNRFRHFEVNYRFQLVQTVLQRFAAGSTRQLDQLSHDLGVSYPSLRRYFIDALGYSPKYCQKLIRFKKALHLYQQYGSRYPFEETGYTDFSHFVKEARQLTQRAPSEL